jgi:hypothetical protein
MKQKLLIALLIAGAALVPAATNAQHLSIEVGDRPYYTHGAEYTRGGRRYVWVPGHWSPRGHVWIHGHYVVREGGRRWR